MTIKESKETFIRAGGDLQARPVKAVLAAADKQARAEAGRMSAPPNPRAAGWIKRALGWLAVGFFIVALIPGTVALLTVIPAAEFAAVYAGMEIITPGKPVIAALTTAALFIGIVVLMFLKHVYEDALPRDQPYGGLRQWVGRVARWAGVARWAVMAENRTKIERDYLALAAALNISKVAVLLMSLMGRLSTLLQAHGNLPVAEAWMSMRATITGQELIGAFASLLVLFGMLRMLDVGVLFGYTAFKNSAGSLDLTEARPGFLEHYGVLRDQYQAAALDDLTLQITVQQQTNS